MTTALKFRPEEDSTSDTCAPPRVVTGGGNHGAQVSNTFLSDHYPLVFTAGDRAEWSVPTTDSFDRALRKMFNAPETRDIVRALLRHRRGGPEGRAWAGNVVRASDEDLECWTGIDASNIGRKVTKDKELQTYVAVTRGKRRTFGNEIEATEYDLTRFFSYWRSMNLRDAEAPTVELVAVLLESWTPRAAKGKPKREKVGNVTACAGQALAEVEQRLGRPLKRGPDLNKVLKRAKELMVKKGAEQ